MTSAAQSTLSSPAKVGPTFWERYTLTDLRNWIEDTHHRSQELMQDLTDEQFLGPKLTTVNPLLWEIGHVAWFYEKFLLRYPKPNPSLVDATDSLYDSIAIPHNVRWDLPLLTRAEVLKYVTNIRDRVIEQLHEQQSDERTFLYLLSIYHQDQHNEAYVINRQAWGYPCPKFAVPDGVTIPDRPSTEAGPYPGDVEIPGGTFGLGSTPEDPFVYDNEKWRHEVLLQPFAIAKAPVTQAEYLAFVEDAGYERDDLWTEQSRQWRDKVQAKHPVYWEKHDGQWSRRDFDQWVPLEPHRPVINVCWHEANAFCRWAKRRLPTEAEWEAAATLEGCTKRGFPWGEESPSPQRANLDGFLYGTVDVGAYPDADAPAGCRQMIGNTWEWTASDFLPFPGFVADHYKENSEPWFGDHKVLRGGCWLTRGRMIRCNYRNFYKPDRHDVWAGFRTCALRDEPSTS